MDNRILVMIGIWLAVGALYMWAMRRSRRMNDEDESC